MTRLIVIVRRFSGALGAVMEAADRVAGGDYAVRVGEYGPPPIRALVRSFNTMTERLELNDRRRRDLMADVAHELRTPLTVMQGRLEGLIDGVYPRDDRRLAQVLEDTRVLARLVEDLRTLALSESGALNLQKESTDVAALAREVANAFSAEAGSQRVALEVDAPGELPAIDIDPVRIREVLTNLVSNALGHTPEGGSVTLTVREAGGMAVEVRDTGAGMEATGVARMFERFYKGHESRGSGLGLAIARGIVVAHGGDITASSAPGRGTTIAFTLPRESDS